MVVGDFFDKSELDPAREAIELLVDGLAQKLYDAGKIKGLQSARVFLDLGAFRLSKM